MIKPVSLIEFILEEERLFPKAKGNFTLLLAHIEYASRIIASHIKKAGLVDIPCWGSAPGVNCPDLTSWQDLFDS